MGNKTEILDAIASSNSEDEVRRTVMAALENDPLGFFFEIWDAENAEAAAKLHDERLYETLFGKIKRDGIRKKRRPPSWPYERQPYCLVQRKDSTWTVLGREYKKLGTAQSHSAGWCDWDATDHVVWEFDCGDPRELLTERIFREASPNNHPKSTCLYLPFYERDYGRRVARLVRATVDPRRYAVLLLGSTFDPPKPLAMASAA